MRVNTTTSSASTSTAGTTGTPPAPLSIGRHNLTLNHGNFNEISTQRQVNAANARATLGLSPSGAQSYARGQQVAFLGDQTHLVQAHELAHVVQQRPGF